MAIPSKGSDRKSSGLPRGLEASQEKNRANLPAALGGSKPTPSRDETPAVESTKIPTEILGISKLLAGNERVLNYLKVSQSLEQLKIQDVTHVITRALEEDPAGTWSSLKKATEDDVVAAKKFVDDLNVFLTSVESLIGSLDVSSSQKGFEEKFRDFLTGKLVDGLSPASARSVSISDIISVPIDNLSSSDIMLLLFRELRSRSTNFNNGYAKAAFELTSVIGQTRPYDPNSDGNYPWDAITRFSQSNNISELSLCIHALSSTMNLSVGIAKAKSIQSETGLSVSTIADVDKVFDGVKLTSVQKLNEATTKVVSDGSLYTKRIEPLNYALKIARYDKVDGTKVIPSRKLSGENYVSGERALVRDPIAIGNLNFDELGLYNDQLEASTDRLQRITESLVGFLDNQNTLDPFSIIRAILTRASDALALAAQNDICKFQLAALTAFTSLSQESKQYILRCLGAIKFNRLKIGSTKASPNVVVTTTKTSNNSEEITDSAEVKTVQTSTTTKSDISDRIISRAASDNSQVDDKANNFYFELINLYNNLGVQGNYTFAENFNRIFDAQFARDSWEKEGTIFSLMVDVYDDLISDSTASIPDEYKITNSLGYTSCGSMDEYAVLSLITAAFGYTYDYVLPNSHLRGSYEIGLSGDVIGAVSFELQSITDGIAGSAETELRTEYKLISKHVETYQNAYAFLNAYSRSIKEFRRLAITNFTELSKDLSFSSDDGRLRALSEITPHGVALRRATLKKWSPSETSGYLPRVFSNVSPVVSYLSNLNSEAIPNCFADNSLKNLRVLHVGVPKSTITGQTSDKSNLVKVSIGKVDYRYHIANAFERKDYVFDPALFLGNLGPSAESSETEYYLFDRSGELGPYSYFDINVKYASLNPDVDAATLKQVVVNAYNSAMIERYHYYTSGFVLDESTAIDNDTSISNAGINALNSLSNLSIPDISLPPASSISSIFQDGYVNFNETSSGVSTPKKEILANLASSYILRSSRVLSRLARDFNHDRVFMVPVDPDSFTLEINSNIVLDYGLTFSDVRPVSNSDSSTRVFLKDQDPHNGGMSVCSFSALVSDYRPIIEAPATAPESQDDVPDESVNPRVDDGTPRSRGSWGSRPPEQVVITPPELESSDPGRDQRDRNSDTPPSRRRTNSRRPQKITTETITQSSQVSSIIQNGSTAMKSFNPKKRR